MRCAAEVRALLQSEVWSGVQRTGQSVRVDVIPCPCSPCSADIRSTETKPGVSAPRSSLRMGLPSKGRMAEDTLLLMKVGGKHEMSK